jgi:hypothetical protein
MQGRVIAWAVLAAGGLALGVTVYQGVKGRGAALEAGKWRDAIQSQVKETRSTNRNVDTGTLVEQGTLQQQEESIRQKWRTMGRTPDQEKKP